MAPDVAGERNRGETDRIPETPTFRSYSPSLKNASEREKTFANWKVDFLNCKDLARLGFYYTNRGDIVKCAFCDVEIGCWNEGDVPENDHRNLAPECPLVRNEVSGNGVEADGKEEETPSQDVCGYHGLEIRPFSAPERSKKVPATIESNASWRDFEELGVSRISGPVSPYYATYSARLKTFETWTKSEIQSPEKLAEAGFYYTLVQDNVLCFHCGGGLMNWEVEDDPWVEHARWFSRCGFVILWKGREFIREVLQKVKAESTKGAAAGQEPSQEEVGEEKKEREESPKPPPASNSDKESDSNSDGKDTELCRICYVRERGIVFLPCGHFVSCPECVASLSTCAVCRKPFEATVRAYLS